MSSRARRISDPGAVITFPWDPSRRGRAEAGHEVPAATEPPAPPDAATIEREAFAKGFAQGEIAGAAAALEQGQGMLRRLMQTLEELTLVRADMIRRTERQMVELALAVARRIAHREISLDRNLLITMARVALDRLGESARVTVRFNPYDFEAIGGADVGPTLGTSVTVLADPNVERGGCRVDSDLGTVDAGVDAQIQEFARALLGDGPAEALSRVA